MATHADITRTPNAIFVEIYDGDDEIDWAAFNPVEIEGRQALIEFLEKYGVSYDL